METVVAIKDLAIRGVIQPIKFTKLGFSNTPLIAHREGLTFCDASYITIAKGAEATPITEAKK